MVILLTSPEDIYVMYLVQNWILLYQKNAKDTQTEMIGRRDDETLLREVLLKKKWLWHSIYITIDFNKNDFNHYCNKSLHCPSQFYSKFSQIQ